MPRAVDDDPARHLFAAPHRQKDPSETASSGTLTSFKSALLIILTANSSPLSTHVASNTFENLPDPSSRCYDSVSMPQPVRATTNKITMFEIRTLSHLCMYTCTNKLVNTSPPHKPVVLTPRLYLSSNGAVLDACRRMSSQRA